MLFGLICVNKFCNAGLGFVNYFIIVWNSIKFMGVLRCVWIVCIGEWMKWYCLSRLLFVIFCLVNCNIFEERL